jgi:mannose-6-phosphate isomerase
MHADAESVRTHTRALEARLRAAAPAGLSDTDRVVLRLCDQFPGDVGVFSPYWLNVLTLSPGQAIFLGANEPHAYLSGDCVEVMACSDNVVRAGLTPKFKDVATLCGMLTYNSGRPSVIEGARVDGATRQYVAPVPEFVLQATELSPGAAPYTLPPAGTASIIVVVEGAADAVVTGAAAPAAADARAPASQQRLAEGQIWLQPATAAAVTLAPAPGSGRFLMFRTHANPDA